MFVGTVFGTATVDCKIFGWTSFSFERGRRIQVVEGSRTSNNFSKAYQFSIDLSTRDVLIDLGDTFLTIYSMLLSYRAAYSLCI